MMSSRSDIWEEHVTLIFAPFAMRLAHVTSGEFTCICVNGYTGG